MGKKLVIADVPEPYMGRCMVLYEENRPLSVSLSLEENCSEAGAVYVGRVEKMQLQTGAAFVRYRKDSIGYLPVAADMLYYGRRGMTFGLPGTGEEILVQVEKDPIKTKKPRLTAKLMFTGKYFVLKTDHFSVRASKKISAERAEFLKQFILHHLPENRPPLCVIARTAAEEAENRTLLADLQSLLEEYLRVTVRGTNRVLYTRLRAADEEWRSVFRHEQTISEVVTDSERVYRQIIEEEQGAGKEAEEGKKSCPAVRLYTDMSVSLFRLYQMTGLWKHLLTKTVSLASGGSLIIEQTEAFVSVDINTGSGRKKKTAEEAAFLTNMEALPVLAEEIRMRNLSGMILVDLVGRPNGEEEEQLLSLMRREVSGDPCRISVSDITKLGIMEIVREKKNMSFAEQHRRMERICAERQRG